MADFRQNSPQIDTRVTGESYSSSTTSPAASILASGATAFSSFIEGQDKAVKRQYAINDEARAQASELRAQGLEQRQLQEYDQTLRERAAADQTALSNNDAETRVMVATLASKYGFPVQDFDFTFRNKDQLTSLLSAAAEADRLEGIASGSGRGSHLLGILSRAKLTELISQDPTMADEYYAAFKQQTGKTPTELTNSIMETAQAEQTRRAEALIQQRIDYRKAAFLPSTMSDSEVDQHMARQRRVTENLQAMQVRTAALNLNESQRVVASRQNRQSATNDIHVAGVEAIQALYADVNKLGRPPTASEAQTFVNRVDIAANQFLVSTARTTGSTIEEVRNDFPFIKELVDNFKAYATGKTSKEVSEARLATSRAVYAQQILDTPAPGGGTIGQLVARSEIIDDLIPPNPSPAMQMLVDRLVIPSLKPTLEALTGAPHRGLWGEPARNQPRNPSGKSDLGEFLGFSLGGNVRQNVDPASVPLSRGRSVLNVPAPLRANVGVSRSLNARLDGLNAQLSHLNWNAENSRTEAFADFVEAAADPKLVGTFHIDPKIVNGVNNALIEYTRRTIIAMNEDFARETGNRIVGGYGTGSSLEYSIPVSWGGGAGLNNGVSLKERADGGVYFVVDPNITDSTKVANAAKLAEMYNRKYALPIQNIVRAYAHLRQDDPFDYRSALGTVLTGGVALDEKDVIRAAAAKLVTESHGQISLQEAEDIIKSTTPKG